ncbi:hypothetical protein N7507_007846 [Penicillium longicatenatum]|nr:hypothetical protein N7507_007846 [Penicillium longicatenatum]
MIIKANVLFALLAGSALAIPAKEPTSSHNTGRTLKCTVDGKTAKIHEDAAKQIAKTAPAGKDINTKSSYPHIFENYDKIQWDNHACNSIKVKTLEFPIDETGRLYPWNGVWIGDTLVEKKKEPGPCRVVYSETDGHFCGVMCHKSMKAEGDQGFDKCT